MPTSLLLFLLAIGGAGAFGFVVAYVGLRLAGGKGRQTATMPLCAAWIAMVLVAVPLLRWDWPDLAVFFLISTPTVLLLIWGAGRPTRWPSGPS